MFQAKRVLYLFILGLITLCSYGAYIDPVDRFSFQAVSLYLYNNYLFVGGGEKVDIYDLADPAKPLWISSFPVPYPVNRITVTDSIAVAVLYTTTENNILIVNVANIASPKVLFERRTESVAKSVSSINRKIYITQDSQGLIEATLTGTNDLLITRTLATDRPVTDVEVVGNRAYVTTDNAVLIVDISESAGTNTLKILDSVVTNQDPFYSTYNALSVDGNLLAVADGTIGVTVYDISNPDKLKYLKTISSYGENYFEAVFLRQKFCYAAVDYTPSFDPGSPGLASPGGLRIFDLDPIASASEIYRNNLEIDRNFFNAYDVVAYNGYVYVAEDAALGIYKHGPVGERPTPTPVIPTPTPTPTLTPTPTNTPPFLATATVSSQATNTPVRETPPPVYTPTPTLPAGNTPIPSQPSPTPTVPSSNNQLIPLFTADFDGPLLGNEQFAAQLPFGKRADGSDFNLAAYSIGAIPTDNAFSGATNGRGLIVSVKAGEAVTFLGPFLSVSSVPALLRVNVRSTSKGANVAMAALDGGFDGSVATNIPVNSALFSQAYKRLTLIYKAPTNAIIPILQVAAEDSTASSITVYFDNFELIPLPSGSQIPADMLGADGTAP